MKGAPRIPPGFVDDALQEADIHLLFNTLTNMLMVTRALVYSTPMGRMTALLQYHVNTPLAVLFPHSGAASSYMR